MARFGIVFAVIGVVACSDPQPAAEIDGGVGGADAADTGLPDVCEGPCAVMALSAQFASTTAPFDVAYYGLTAPGATDSGEWELHVEAFFGAADGCPEANSPSPDRTVVISGLQLFDDAVARVDPAGAGASLLDFEGSLLSVVPVSGANGFTVTPVAARVCTECVGLASPSDPDGFVSFDFSAAFDDGTISGHVYATHCDSLDATE